MRWLRIAVLSASLLTVLGTAEVVLRLLGYEPLHAVYSRPDLFWRHDERLGWSLEPGARFLLLVLPADLRRLDAAALRTAGIESRHVPASARMGRIRFRNDPHMNAAGHEYYAEGLVPIVSEPIEAILRERAGRTSRLR